MKNFKLFAFMFILMLIIGCRDSLKYRLTSRLNDFRKALPGEIKIKFDNGEYEEAGKMLDDRLIVVKSYIPQFDSDDKKRKYIIGDYSGLEEDIKNISIPQEVLDFNKKLYPIIDFECIPTFTGHQIIDFFKVYFKEKLESMQEQD